MIAETLKAARLKLYQEEEVEMKRKMLLRWLALVAGLFILTTGPALAVDSTVTVNAEIVAATLTASPATLDFGRISSAGVDTVVINARDSGGIDPVPTDTNITNVTGGGNGIITVASLILGASVTITYPANVTIAEAGGATMLVDQIELNSTLSPITLVGGTAEIYVGGRLNISNAQVAEEYTADMTVTVDFE